MRIQEILSIVLKPGNDFYRHQELMDSLYKLYDILPVSNNVFGNMMAKAGIKGKIKKINGHTVRGFELSFKKLSMQEVESEYQRVSNITLPGREKDVLELHRKVRFLLKDWDTLDINVQLDYRSHRKRYFDEIRMDSPHETGWFYNILRDCPLHSFPENGDFLIMYLKDIVKDLQILGTIKDKKPSKEKADFLITDAGWKRLDDFMYGINVTNKIL